MSKRLKRWGIAVLICIVVLGMAIVLIERWMNTSTAGTVHVGDSVAATTQTPEAVDIKTAYFTTLLPAGFNIKTHTETPAEAVQLRLVADASSNADEQFAVTTGTMPADGLHGLGDYNLRTKQTDSYKPFTPANLPTGATAFQNANGAAGFVAFWPHGKQYAEVALSTGGAATLEDLQVVFTQAMSAWQWQ